MSLTKTQGAIFDAYFNHFPKNCPSLIWFRGLPQDERARIIEEQMLPALDSGEPVEFETSVPVGAEI